MPHFSFCTCNVFQKRWRNRSVSLFGECSLNLLEQQTLLNQGAGRRNGKQVNRFQWVEDMVLLAEVVCLCTSCRWLLFCWLPESVGYLASPRLHAKWQLGLVTCRNPSWEITSYFLTLYHKLNHTTNTEILWWDSWWWSALPNRSTQELCCWFQ